MTTSTVSFDGGARKAQVDEIGIVFKLPQKFSPSGAKLFNSYRIDSFGSGRHVFIKFGDSTMVVGDLAPWLTLIALIKVIVASDTSTYTVTLNGTPFNYPANTNDTAQEIVNGLIAAIPGGTYNATNVNDELVVERIDKATFPVTVAATGVGELSTEDTLASGNLVAANGFIDDVGIIDGNTHIGLICPPNETAEVIVLVNRVQVIPQQGP